MELKQLKVGHRVKRRDEKIVPIVHVSEVGFRTACYNDALKTTLEFSHLPDGRLLLSADGSHLDISDADIVDFLPKEFFEDAKESFGGARIRNVRRERIATATLQAILSDSSHANMIAGLGDERQIDGIAAIARMAVAYADALIQELDS